MPAGSKQSGTVAKRVPRRDSIAAIEVDLALEEAFLLQRNTAREVLHLRITNVGKQSNTLIFEAEDELRPIKSGEQQMRGKLMRWRGAILQIFGRLAHCEID